jgi:hypothetical protein
VGVEAKPFEVQRKRVRKAASNRTRSRSRQLCERTLGHRALPTPLPEKERQQSTCQMARYRKSIT